ncbi:active regulator of SIRT1 [Aplochiton taeniatus]
MSASIIRRGLEFLSNDIKDGSKKTKKKQQTPNKAKAMKLVKTNRQGVSKQVKRLQGRLGSRKSRATVKDKRTKSAVEEYRKKQGKSYLKNNLQYFLTTGYVKADKSDTMKILSHNGGRQSRNHPVQSVKKTPEPKSLFTEEEFQQFQKEYFGRTVEDVK